MDKGAFVYLNNSGGIKNKVKTEWLTKRQILFLTTF